jgi:hypothetical protein
LNNHFLAWLAEPASYPPKNIAASTSVESHIQAGKGLTASLCSELVLDLVLNNIIKSFQKYSRTIGRHKIILGAMGWVAAAGYGRETDRD